MIQCLIIQVSLPTVLYIVGLFLAFLLFPFSMVTLVRAFMLLCAARSITIVGPVAISHAIHTEFLSTSMSFML